MPYTADSLQEIAEQFERRASILVTESVGTKGIHKARELIAESRGWRNAAAMLRETTLRTAIGGGWEI